MNSQKLLESLQKDLRSVNTNYQAHAQIERIIGVYQKQVKEAENNGQKKEAKS